MKKNDATTRLEKRLRDLKISYDQSVAESLDTKKRTGTKYVAFQLDKEIYAWPVSHISEIMGYRSITPIPGDAPLLHGIINNKNQIVCVLNLHRQFRLPQPQIMETTRLIFTKKLTETRALLVDHLVGIYQVDPKMFTNRTSVRDKNTGQYIRGEFYEEEALISVLIPEAFQTVRHPEREH